MTFNYSQPYPSRRSPVMGQRGAVATSHPLAAQVGIEILREGGNAVDAAVAVAAALTVLEPTSNGLGSDAFAIVWDGKKLHGLNASGRSPQELTLDTVREHGVMRDGTLTIPTTGWLPVTVPGAVSAWAALTKRFGSMPLSRLVEPAARYAETGHPVPPMIAHYWSIAESRYGEDEALLRSFLPQGRSVRAGESFACP